MIHHRRDGDEIATRIMSNGDLAFDPPGVTVSIDALWQGLTDAETGMKP